MWIIFAVNFWGFDSDDDRTVHTVRPKKVKQWNVFSNFAKVQFPLVSNATEYYSSGSWIANLSFGPIAAARGVKRGEFFLRIIAEASSVDNYH